MARAALLLALAFCARAQNIVSTTIGLEIFAPVFATDSQGNIYAAGIANRAGLPSTPGAVQAEYAAGTCISISGFIGQHTYPCYDIFIAKLDPSGKRVLAGTYFGGSAGEGVSSIAVGEDGAIYISGSSDSPSFLPGDSARTQFAAKLSASLDRILYSVRAPAERIALDRSGNLWSAGSLSNERRTLLTRIDPAGTVTLSRTIEDFNFVAALALDEEANPVAVGTRGEHTIVAPFNSLGERTGTVTVGNYQYRPRAVAAAAGEVYVAGSIEGNWALPDPPGGFLTHVRPNGTMKTIRTGQVLTATAIAPDGRVFAAGMASAGLPATANAVLRCRVGDRRNAILVAWDGTNDELLYASYLGALAADFGGRVSVDATGLVSVVAPSAIVRIRPDAESGQAACLDSLPANLADSKLFPSLEPYQVPHAIAPGEFVVFYGSGIGPSSEVKSDPRAEGGAPSELGGVRLLIGGRPAPLLSVSNHRIIAIVPFGVAGQEKTAVEVERDGVVVASAEVPVASSVPAIFSPGGTKFSQNAVFNSDWTVNSESNPASPGDMLSVFVSGAGAMSPAPADGALVSGERLPEVAGRVQAFISGSGYQVVEFAGQANGEVAGLTQVNFRVGHDFAFHGRMTLELFFDKGSTAAFFWVK